MGGLIDTIGSSATAANRGATTYAATMRLMNTGSVFAMKKTLVQVAFHSSQFPENVARDLRESLRARQVNHKFLYDGLKQTRKWLALHQAYSPSRTDADCARAYDSSFEAAAARLPASRVHLVGLGCGGGRKDSRLLALLRASGKEVFYTPSDVSAAMVLVARQTALGVIAGRQLFPTGLRPRPRPPTCPRPSMNRPFPAPRGCSLSSACSPTSSPSLIPARLGDLVRPGIGCS